MQPHLRRHRRHRHRIRMLRPLAMTLQPTQRIIPLYEPRNRIPGRRQRILLAQTDPRPAIERQELPAGLAIIPALGLELVGIGAEEVLAAVHDVHGVVDLHALGHEDGRGAVRAPADGEGRVAEGVAGVEGDGGVEAEAFVL
jgi:hypothetical protein